MLCSGPLVMYEAHSFVVVVHGDDFINIVQGSHLREKTSFFTQKKSRLRKSENAVRLLYAKNSDLTYQNAFSLFVFCTQQRRFVEHLQWV